MAGPSEQDKLADDWGIEDIGAADTPAAPIDESEMSEEERAAAAAAEWAAMLEGGDGSFDEFLQRVDQTSHDYQMRLCRASGVVQRQATQTAEAAPAQPGGEHANTGSKLGQVRDAFSSRSLRSAHSRSSIVRTATQLTDVNRLRHAYQEARAAQVD